MFNDKGVDSSLSSPQIIYTSVRKFLIVFPLKKAMPKRKNCQFSSAKEYESYRDGYSKGE